MDFQSQMLGLLLQLGAIVACARLGGVAFRRLGQPEVVGEILAGLLLGPSLLGRVAPEWLRLPVAGESAHTLRTIAELGLVFLMFLIGLDFEFAHLRRVGTTAAAVAVAGVVAPFAVGIAVACAIHPAVAAEVPRWEFAMFFAVALSITAIPILGRIMVDLGVQRTPLGTLTITAAAVDDALGWVLLAVVGMVVREGLEPARIAVSVLGLAALVALFTLSAAPLSRLSAASRRLERDSGAGPAALDPTTHGVLVVLVLLSAAATSALGVFAILGPFLLGAALASNRPFADAVVEAWRPLVYGLLLPVFFTSTGLRTDVGGLQEPWQWGVCLAVVAAATAGKMLGCGGAALWGGLGWRSSMCVAVMMNTRALMGLVAINVGRDLGVVPDQVFSMLVIMAVATTVVTMPALRALLRDDTTWAAVPAAAGEAQRA